MTRALFAFRLPKTTPKSVAMALGFICAFAVANASPKFSGPFDSGLMTEPRNRESSGLAASSRDPQSVWTLVDGGNDAVLFALGTEDGSLRGKVHIDGVENIDWEDLAGFELDGRSWLLVADVGDNTARRPFVWLHLIEEPDPRTLSPRVEIRVKPRYSVKVAYEDLARDCESVAVDPSSRTIYLLSKRDKIPQLYALPLEPATDLVIARRVGQVPHLPKPTAFQIAFGLPSRAFRAQPSAMDFARDGSGAVVLTYGDLLYFPRSAGESWPTVLAGVPVVLPRHLLPQAEAVCFSADGRSIYVSSEKTMRMLRYSRKR